MGLSVPGTGAASRQVPSGLSRAVHLVDAENLLGTAVPRPADVRQLAARYAAVIGFGPMDQVVIACSHLAFKTIGFCWPGPQYLLRSGPDGADLALLAVLQHDHIAARFPRAVIASGDHIFAQAVTDLTTSGCRVTIATRRGHLSRSLELAAGHRIIYLDPLAAPPPTSPLHDSPADYQRNRWRTVSPVRYIALHCWPQKFMAEMITWDQADNAVR